MQYFLKKRTRNIARYNTSRTFLDVYRADTGLILYSHPLEDEEQFPWGAALSPDGRFTVLWTNRSLTGEEDYDVAVYDTRSSTLLYGIPDPHITFDLSGEVAYRSEVMYDKETNAPLRVTHVLDALTGEILETVIDGGALFESGLRALSQDLLPEGEPEGWYEDALPSTTQSAAQAVILPGEGVKIGGKLLGLGQTTAEVKAIVDIPDEVWRSEEMMIWYFPSRGMILTFVADLLVYLSLLAGIPKPFDYSRYQKFVGTTPEGVGLGDTPEKVIAAYGTPEKDIEMHFAGLPYRWLDYSTTRGVEFSFIPRSGLLFKIDLSSHPK